MADLKFIKHEVLTLKNHPDYNEKWLQNRIAEDPTLLGLGDLVLRDRERTQPKAGRLDLLLQDPETNSRYEVEIQLGQTDETHIIRTIEYWDVERKRYPQYDHTAVIVAEDITSRFLNVISLFNGSIPLIAIQLSAIKIGDSLSLVFSKVIDLMTLGFTGEDEEITQVTDRDYWIKRATKDTVAMADTLLQLVKSVDQGLELKYNKFYIGLAKNEKANNFVTFVPQKSALKLSIRIPKSDDTDKKLTDSGLVVLTYDKQWGNYQVRLTVEDLKRHSALLRELFQLAFDQ